ncbi:DUF2849 domain-containing protein [Amphiplicatus metriothermophilus]|uniref:DUF2849 domain-containing protein n=1 Tax=Amphiplicatus metriothermophilus TaxID=1519374 RepID=A0A239PMR2_9PROT|nr:DUF2849 domain-containing protein [Amphiplicatus metriothermophilus]MBB5517250.1 hypothetical protein [Amphiplicatus metriothermophilus]SNT68414.1 Protein of unknown function [Amphiplicatus metriothermophilus]
MKAITGNRLTDGVVVYLAPDGTWTERLEKARLFEKEEAEAALEAARRRVTEIASVYLIEAEPGGKAAGREALRETIRNAGPTVRPDLGKQAAGPR